MGKKKFRIKTNDILSFVVMFLFIIMSGTAIGLEYSAILDPLFLGVATLICIIRKGIKKNSIEQIRVAIILLLFYLMNVVIYMGDGVNIRGYLSYMIRITACLMFCMSMSINQFEKWFLIIVDIIAVYSLIFFVLGQVTKIALYTKTVGNYPVLFLYNFNGYLLHRNSGIFWEPGAYQFFINLALVFNFKKNDYNIRKCINWSSLVLGISLLTTRSTTGYFALLLLLLYLLYKNWSKLSVKCKIGLLIPMLVLGAVIFYMVMTSSVVVDKFYGAGQSYSIRKNDFLSSIIAIKERPFLGYGIGTGRYQAMCNSLGLTANSVGFFVASIYFGVVYAIYYSYRIFRFGVVNNKGSFLLIVAIILLSMFSEDFYRYAIYFAFAIGFRKVKNDSKNSKKNSI